MRRQAHTISLFHYHCEHVALAEFSKCQRYKNPVDGNKVWKCQNRTNYSPEPFTLCVLWNEPQGCTASLTDTSIDVSQPTESRQKHWAVFIVWWRQTWKIKSDWILKFSFQKGQLTLLFLYQQIGKTVKEAEIFSLAFIAKCFHKGIFVLCSLYKLCWNKRRNTDQIKPTL